MNKGTLRFRRNAGGFGRWYLDLGIKPWLPATVDLTVNGIPIATSNDDASKEALRAWRDQIAATRTREGLTAVRTKPATVDDYFLLWIADRKLKGIRTTKTERSKYRRHISPRIGHLEIATVAKSELRALVEHLDEKTRTEARFKPKTARNCWGLVSKMLKDAASSRTAALVVREDNPARDVLPPLKGVERVGAYLYPAEFAAIVVCARVPVRWKRLITVASYLGARRGELEPLDWAAVDLDRKFVSVHQAVDADTRDVKGTKTGVARKVPIEPTLLPLLTMMRKEAEDAGELGRVFSSMPPDEEMASRLRKYVGWAGIKRAALTTSDATQRHLSWHDLRHGYATWRIVRGDSPKKVQRAGGWKTAAMVDRYVAEAETFEDEATFGTTFPPLPLDEFRYPVPHMTGHVTGRVPAALGPIKQRGYSVPKGIRTGPTTHGTPENKALHEGSVTPTSRVETSLDDTKPGRSDQAAWLASMGLD